MMPDLVKSFVHPYKIGTPSFDFLLTNHISKDVNFRPLDYSTYFFTFFSSFIFIIPETKLEQDLRIITAYYQFMPENVGLKSVFILNEVDEHGAKIEKYSMQIRNVFFNQKYDKWRRGLSYDDYKGLGDRLSQIGIDIRKCGYNIEEYLIRPTNIYKEATTMFDSKKKLSIIVQKMKVHDSMIQAVEPDGYITSGASPKFINLRRLIVDAFHEDRKPVEDTILFMEQNQLTGNGYVANVIKPFLMLIPEVYQMASAFYNFKLPDSKLSLCAFTHGAMAALSNRMRLTPKIFHKIAQIYESNEMANEDKFYMSLAPSMENAADIQQVRTPITLCFVNREEAFTQVPIEDMSNMVRLGVRSQLNTERIMLLVNYAFRQGVVGTTINYPENNKLFVPSLIRLFESVSKNDFRSAATLHHYITHVTSFIFPMDVAHNVNKIHKYMSRYFLGIISATHGSSKYAAFVEEPTKSDEVNFVFRSSMKEKSILLKFIEKPMPLEGHTDTTNIHPSYQDGWDTLMITVEQHFEHGTNDFSMYHGEDIEDFLHRKITFNYDKFENVKPTGQMVLLEHFDLESQSSNNNDLHLPISSFFNRFSFLIGNEYHASAIFDGLLSKIPHAKFRSQFSDYQITVQCGNRYRIFNFGKFSGSVAESKMHYTLRDIKARFPGVGMEDIFNFFISEEGQLSIGPQLSCTRQKRSDACTSFKELNNVEDTHIYDRPFIKENLESIKKISNNIMAGFMIRDFVSDLINGDKSSALMDGSLAIGSILANSLASYVEGYGATMMENGKTALGAGLKTVAPVLHRIASVYVLHHLIQSINQYKLNSNDTSLKVDIATDSAFLTLDAMESSVEVMELFGVIEGISAITGPVSALLGAFLITGSNIYQTVHTMESINKEIRLNFVEEIETTLSTMMHLNLGEEIMDFIQEHKANQHIKKQVIAFLKSQPRVKYFITEAASMTNGICMRENDTVIDLRKVEFFKNSKANPSNETNYGIFCQLPDDSSQHKTVVKEGQSLWERIKSGFTDFLWDIKLLKDALKHDFDGMLYDVMHLDPQEVSYSHVCHQSFGVMNQNSTSDVAFFQLYIGYDKVHGFLDRRNVFNLSDGQKEIYGGHLNDIFILNGKNVTGLLEGAGGIDQLHFTNFDPRGVVEITESRFTYSYSEQNNSLFLLDINQIFGRPEASDIVQCACNHTFIDLKGGFDEYMMDMLQISASNKCSSYNMEIVVGPYTFVNNTAWKGNFSYLLNEYTNMSTIFMIGTNQVKHQLFFPFSLGDLERLTHSNAHEIIIYSTLGSHVTIIINDSLSSLEIHFSDGTLLSAKEPGHFIIHLKTDMILEKVVDMYYSIVMDFNFTMVAYSTTDKKSMTLSNGIFYGDEENPINVHVMHVDPYHPSHVHCLSREMFLIMNASMNMPEFTIDTTNPGCSKVALDFSTLESKLFEVHPNLDVSINAISKWPNMKLIIRLQNSTYVEEIGQVVLVSEEHAIEKLEIISHGHRQILKHKNSEGNGLEYRTVDHYGHGFTHLQDGGNAFHNVHDDNILLQSEPLEYDKDVTLLYITFRDVEQNQFINIGKQFEYYRYYKINDTLIITNIFEKCFFDKENLLTIVLENFYIWPKLQTLNFKFNNNNMTMSDENVDARDISDLWDQIIVNDRVFFH